MTQQLSVVRLLKGANLTCLGSSKNSMWLPSLGLDPILAMVYQQSVSLTIDLPPDCKFKLINPVSSVSLLFLSYLLTLTYTMFYILFQVF